MEHLGQPNRIQYNLLASLYNPNVWSLVKRINSWHKDHWPASRSCDWNWSNTSAHSEGSTAAARQRWNIRWSCTHRVGRSQCTTCTYLYNVLTLQEPSCSNQPHDLTDGHKFQDCYSMWNWDTQAKNALYPTSLIVLQCIGCLTRIIPLYKDE